MNNIEAQESVICDVIKIRLKEGMIGEVATLELKYACKP